MPTGSYVLVTAVRNEESTIGITISSVIAQTCRPSQWVIVDDDSTDKTGAIIAREALSNPWINPLTLRGRNGRSFASMVRAIELGRKHLTYGAYEYFGLLDGDLRFNSNYFATVIDVLNSNSMIGVTGGMVVDVGDAPQRYPDNVMDVPGAVQMFRRGCYEKLGGYLPIPEGGFDAVACAQARMLGFETRLLTNLVVEHLKPRNLHAGNRLRRKWQLGIRDYAMGYHPLFEIAKCASRVGESPALFGTLAWLFGYMSRAIMARKRVVPDDIMAYLRNEQIRRLRSKVCQVR